MFPFSIAVIVDVTVPATTIDVASTTVVAATTTTIIKQFVLLLEE